jgi:hypothetical protein
MTMTEEIVADSGPDATQFCEGCVRWTLHEMNDDGSYSCELCQ